jgi:hypothetical protein
MTHLKKSRYHFTLRTTKQLILSLLSRLIRYLFIIFCQRPSFPLVSSWSSLSTLVGMILKSTSTCITRKILLLRAFLVESNQKEDRGSKYCDTCRCDVTKWSHRRTKWCVVRPYLGTLVPRYLRSSVKRLATVPRWVVSPVEGRGRVEVFCLLGIEPCVIYFCKPRFAAA